MATLQIYGLMEDVVGGSAFLEHLTEAQHKTRQTGSKPPARGDPEWQVLQQEQWWDTPSSNKAGSTENTQVWTPPPWPPARGNCRCCNRSRGGTLFLAVRPERQ